MLQVFCKLGVELSLKDDMCRSLVPSTNTNFQGALATRCLSPQLIWYPKRQKLFFTYFFPHNEKEDCNCDKMSKHQSSPNNPRPEYTRLKLPAFEGKTRNKENEQIIFLLVMLCWIWACQNNVNNLIRAFEIYGVLQLISKIQKGSDLVLKFSQFHQKIW